MPKEIIILIGLNDYNYKQPIAAFPTLHKAIAWADKCLINPLTNGPGLYDTKQVTYCESVEDYA